MTGVAPAKRGPGRPKDPRVPRRKHDAKITEWLEAALYQDRIAWPGATRDDPWPATIAVWIGGMSFAAREWLDTQDPFNTDMRWLRERWDEALATPRTEYDRPLEYGDRVVAVFRESLGLEPAAWTVAH